MTVIAMYGLPRSGKSTIARNLARDLAAPIVSKDAIRLALHGQIYAGEAEDMVRVINKLMIRSLFGVGHEYIVVDETHWSQAAREYIKDGPWKTYFYPVPTPVEVCHERADLTGHTHLHPVLDMMMARVEPLGPTDQLWRFADERPI